MTLCIGIVQEPLDINLLLEASENRDIGYETKSNKLLWAIIFVGTLVHLES